MSFVGQLLGNSALSVDERIRLGNQALARGQDARGQHWYDKAEASASNAINNALLSYANSPASDLYASDLQPSKELLNLLRSDLVQDDVSNLRDKIFNSIESLADRLSSGDPGSDGPSYSSVRPIDNSGSTIDYLNADLAKHYGMDASAAYGEALQNTAYQRAVADLKAAGLNPVLAISGLHPAGSYVTGDTLRSGSGSGSSGGSSSGKSGKYVMSSNMYNAIGAAAQVVGAFVGFKYGTGPFKFMNAATVSQLSKNLVQAAIQGYGSLTEGR